VSGWDDGQGLFLVEYTEREPLAALHYERTEFVPIVKKQYRTTETKVRTGQQRFRFQVSTRYGMVCAASDVNVPQMLQAAHIVPDSEGGSMDPRNGLMLSANLHRAFDAGLWAIHPESFEIITNPSGPSRERLGIKHQDLNHLKKKPAKQALAEHWKKMKKAWDM
jgi:putative restriction endonuclease